jgi:hypothetical protein
VDIFATFEMLVKQVQLTAGDFNVDDGTLKKKLCCLCLADSRCECFALRC